MSRLLGENLQGILEIVNFSQVLSHHAFVLDGLPANYALDGGLANVGVFFLRRSGRLSAALRRRRRCRDGERQRLVHPFQVNLDGRDSFEGLAAQGTAEGLDF